MLWAKILMTGGTRDREKTIFPLSPQLIAKCHLYKSTPCSAQHPPFADAPDPKDALLFSPPDDSSLATKSYLPALVIQCRNEEGDKVLRK